MQRPGLADHRVSVQSPESASSTSSSVEGPNRDQSPTTILETLPIPLTERLVAQFATRIAPTMMWRESESNEYRRLVVPLSDTQKGLKSAIIAIAAAHGCDEGIADHVISRAACRDALQIITDRVRNMIEDGSDGQGTPCGSEPADTNEAVLAAALILKNHSLLYSELPSAQIHRQAVRVLIKSILFRGPSDEELFSFLRNQASIHDVLTCTTMFDAEHIVEAVVPDLKYRSLLFSKFLLIIHDITTMSVRRECSAVQDLQININEIEDRFELARASTLAAAAEDNRTCNIVTDDDFVRLVQVYHHAGVLYALKRLSIPNHHRDEEYHVLRLFRALSNFEDLESALYNLPWPVLIAGICSWPNVERMQMVSRLSNSITENTRFRHYRNISAFHQTLWESSHRDWLLLAKEWESRQIPVVAV